MVSVTAWPPGPAGRSSGPAGSRAVSGSLPEPRPGQVWRIRDRATFEQLRTTGRHLRKGPVTVWWVAGDPAVPPRVAFAVGRAVGNAVQRNRLRRRLRAILSDRDHKWRAGAYLIGVAPPAATLPWDDLRAIVIEALDAVSRSGGAHDHGE